MPYFDAVIAMATEFATSPAFWLVAGATIFMIAFSKGAFGGGGASLGVPLLSFIMDPVSAAIVVAPLISFMDLFVVQSFGTQSWSKPDLKTLIPGLLIGLGLGYLLVSEVDARIVGIVIGGVTLLFVGHWFLFARRQISGAMAPNVPLSLLAGTASGFSTFIAHAGGPPITMYLIRRGLDKAAFVGTMAAFFTLGNLLKLGPYGLLMAHKPATAAAALLLAPIVPLGVKIGVVAHHRFSRDQIITLTNILLVVGGLKLLYDGFVRP